jgi:hypothetical protein
MFSLTLDLDPLWCYYRIFGLQADSKYDPRIDPVTPTATLRFCELCESLDIKGTIFVVGSMLSNPAAAEAIKKAGQLGHEIANHSYFHDYQLSRKYITEIEEDIQKGADEIEGCIGIRPLGFRAPGYSLGPDMLSALVQVGAKYDSSVLPSVSYQMIKMMALGWMKLLGRSSGSEITDPRESIAPSQPYFPDLRQPWKRSDANDGLLEFPISVVTGVPLVGSALALLNSNLITPLAKLAARKSFVNVELHGVDLMDITADELDPTLGVQKDLKTPWQKKAARFSSFIKILQKKHEGQTLREAVEID